MPTAAMHGWDDDGGGKEQEGQWCEGLCEVDSKRECKCEL